MPAQAFKTPKYTMILATGPYRDSKKGAPSFWKPPCAFNAAEHSNLKNHEAAKSTSAVVQDQVKDSEPQSCSRHGVSAVLLERVCVPIEDVGLDSDLLQPKRRPLAKDDALLLKSHDI